MNLTYSVTQEELLDVLLNVAPTRPVFIWGAPGIGKSALVEKFSGEVGLPCVSLLGSQLAPEDIIGIPQIRGDTSEFLPPKIDCEEGALCAFLRRAKRLFPGGAKGILQPDSRTAHR